MAHILLVEDDPAIRNLVTIFLRHQGHEIDHARNGDEALYILTTKPTFDLVITDLHMPGMNGVTLIQVLKSLHPTLPVMIISAYLEGRWTKEAIAASRVALPKPFTRKQLLMAVELAMR